MTIFLNRKVHYASVVMASTYAEQLIKRKYCVLTISVTLHFSKVRENRFMPR